MAIGLSGRPGHLGLHLHEAQLGVVEHEDLDRPVEAHGADEVVHRHAEAAVAARTPRPGASGRPPRRPARSGEAAPSEPWLNEPAMRRPPGRRRWRAAHTVHSPTSTAKNASSAGLVVDWPWRRAAGGWARRGGPGWPGRPWRGATCRASCRGGGGSGRRCWCSTSGVSASSGLLHGADEADRDRCPLADVLDVLVDLDDLDAVGDEAVVGEVGAEHHQHLAVPHRVVARRVADEAGEPDDVRVAVVEDVLGPQRVHDRARRASRPARAPRRGRRGSRPRRRA